MKRIFPLVRYIEDCKPFYSGQVKILRLLFLLRVNWELRILVVVFLKQNFSHVGYLIRIIFFHPHILEITPFHNVQILLQNNLCESTIALDFIPIFGFFNLWVEPSKIINFHALFNLLFATFLFDFTHFGVIAKVSVQGAVHIELL